MDRRGLHFQNLAIFLLRMRTKYTKYYEVFHWKDEISVFQFVLDASPPTTPNMPFGQ